MKYYRFYIFIILFLIPSAYSYSQNYSKIEYSADRLEKHPSMPDVMILYGNVVFSHQGSNLYSDSAYLFTIENRIEAQGHVQIRVSDTVQIYGDNMRYDGNTRFAEVTGKMVRLVDDDATLTTTILTYDRNAGLATYLNGGKIVDKENVLTSKIGYYYTSSKEVYFKKEVLLVNPKYTIDCDTLLFNSHTEIAYFLSPTHIRSKDNLIYCENGWYNTKTDFSQFGRNAYLKNKEQLLKGDSLTYNRKLKLGKAWKNVSLADSVKNIILSGQYAENYEKKGRALITDSVLAIFIDKKDSLFLHADTLRATYDTTNQLKLLRAYYKVKFYREDIQGMCDSMSYYAPDSIMVLHKKPVLWSGENQLSADTIRFIMGENRIKQMFLYNSSFVISQGKEDSLRFDQVKGRNMTGFFDEKGELHRIEVSGNSESIYYVLDDATKDLIGINKTVSSDMLIFIENRKIISNTAINNPSCVMYPEKEFPVNESKLKGFIWMKLFRPMSKWDIFRW